MSIDVSSIPFPASGISNSLLIPHGEERGTRVSNHEARLSASSFETLAAQAPQDEGREPYLAIRDATSAIAFMTALRTPGSYSVCPAPSTVRTSASLQRAASACAVDGGHKRS